MLDAVIELMPSPLDVPAIDGVDEKETRGASRSDDEPFSALAFKLMGNPYVSRRLTLYALLWRVLHQRRRGVSSSEGKKERIGRIVLTDAPPAHDRHGG